MYSPRPGTPAAALEDQVPEAEKSERLQRLQAVITRQWRAFNASFVGQTMDILVEKPGKLTGQLVGRSPYLQSVHVMAPAGIDRLDREGRRLPMSEPTLCSAH